MSSRKLKGVILQWKKALTVFAEWILDPFLFRIWRWWFFNLSFLKPGHPISPVYWTAQSDSKSDTLQLTIITNVCTTYTKGRNERAWLTRYTHVSHAQTYCSYFNGQSCQLHRREQKRQIYVHFSIFGYNYWQVRLFCEMNMINEWGNYAQQFTRHSEEKFAPSSTF